MSVIVCELIIALFLTHFIIRTLLEIHDISPSCGSLQGGTVITIRGLGFSDYANNVVVYVGGM